VAVRVRAADAVVAHLEEEDAVVDLSPHRRPVVRACSATPSSGSRTA
jgi:hypothetical protein